MSARFGRFLVVPALIAILLAGCVTTQGAGKPSPQPIAQQAAAGSRARAKVHTDLGLAYLEDRRPGQALGEARIALRLDSIYPLAHNLLGLVYSDLRENGPAEEAFRTALSLAPADPDVANSYAGFLCKTKREKESLDYFKIAYMNPLFVAPSQAMTEASRCAEVSGDLKAAEDLLVRALGYDPADPRVLFPYAQLAYRLGRYNEARLRLADAHRRSEPNAQSAWLGLRIARRLNDRAEEPRYSSLMRQRFQDSPEYDLFLQGRFE